MSTDRDHRERSDEREYVRSQLLRGRSPAQLHELIDREVANTIASLKDADARARRAQAERDILVELVELAVEHLVPLGAYGDANQIVQRLERSLESLGLQRAAAPPPIGYDGAQAVRA